MALILGPFSSPTTLAVTDAPGQLLGGGQDGRAVDHQDGLQGDLGAHGLAQQLDADTLALGHALLLPSGPDHGIHKGETLAH